MTPIRYARGDATRPPPTPEMKILAHICNDVGAWGAGFVMAVSRRWSKPEAAYREWTGRRLGAIQLVCVETKPDLWVANMIAQRGIGRSDGPPIRYDALADCLAKVAMIAEGEDASVHMPRIGCGLAGGTWDRIEPIITAALSDRGVPVTVYDL